MNKYDLDIEAEGTVLETHCLTRTTDPNDIKQIALELKALMLPEIGTMFKTQFKNPNRIL